MDEIRDAVDVANCLRRRRQGSRIALIEGQVELIRTLGPDLAAAPLGDGHEVGAANLIGLGDDFVLEEQAFNRLAGRGPVDDLGNSYPNSRAGLEVDGHDYSVHSDRPTAPIFDSLMKGGRVYRLNPLRQVQPTRKPGIIQG